MARKRSATGRIAKPSLVSQTYYNLEKANKRVKGLQKHGDLGTYASKDLMRLVSQNKHVKFNRHQKLSISKAKSMTFGELRLVNKKLREFNKAKTATHAGIEEVKTSTRQKMKETLSGLTDQEINDDDVEFVYSLFNDKNTSNIFDFITPSEVFIILKNVEKRGGNFEDFWAELQNYIETTNQADLRETAQSIYSNYIQYKLL